MRSSSILISGAVAAVAVAGMAGASQSFGTLSYPSGAGSTPIPWQLGTINNNNGFLYTNTDLGGGNWLTIGLRASNYFGLNEAPVYADTGSNTFLVEPGVTNPYPTTPPPGSFDPAAARWGFQWSVSVNGSRTSAALTGLWWSLRIDSPTAGDNWGTVLAGMADLGTDAASPQPQYAINGWSPSFGFLGLDSFQSGGPPGAWNGLDFNPNTIGNYTFTLQVRDTSGTVLGSTVMTVMVPAPGAVALLGTAGLVGSRRRRG
jgi:hypothetical protein